MVQFKIQPSPMGKRKRGSKPKTNGGASSNDSKKTRFLKNCRVKRPSFPDTVEPSTVEKSESIEDLIAPFDSALRSRLNDDIEGIQAVCIKTKDKPDLKVEAILKEDAQTVSCLLIYGSNLAIENTIHVSESIKRQWSKTQPSFETVIKIFRIPEETGRHSSRICILLIKGNTT